LQLGVQRCSESLAFSADGVLFLLDKYGTVWQARPQPDGSYDQADLEKVAFIGGGRPLGAHMDAQGNLVVCVAGLVRAPALSRVHPHAPHKAHPRS
jgi:sugar lactone lactonase YvrE